MRFGKTLGAAALAIAVMQTGVGAASAQVSQPAPSAKNPTVAIKAIGTVEAAPDVATISAGLRTENPSSEKAMEENVRGFAKIMAVVKKYGIKAEDLKTSGVTVGEDFDYDIEGKATPRGFVATNNLAIKVRNLDTLGAMISELAAAGSNTLYGPDFVIEDDQAVIDQAREKAFDTAQRSASAYARKAGFKSVRLLMVNENAGEMAYAYAAEAAADAAKSAGDAASGGGVPASIEPGLVSKSVYADFLFEMVP